MHRNILHRVAVGVAVASGLLTLGACSSDSHSPGAAITAAGDSTSSTPSTTIAGSGGATTTAPSTTASATPTTAFTCRRTPAAWDDNVRLGDCDDHGYVQTIEERLTVLGFPCTVDNEFRSDTDAAVRAFQASRGLTVDGQVGVNTWAALTEGGIGD
ncbi:MAG: peptidoglycan-binding domain-containing protein [Actinomycetota bacterium]|nr:peptidoglycan-binding domain-containing protein [Actinomycetota bacterium]